MLFSVVLGIIVTAMCLAYRWRRKHFSIFKDLGIPGPQPSLLYGNFREIQSKGIVHVASSWIAKYGNIVGYYHGSVPFIMINDIDLLKKVMVQDFWNFSGRGALLGLGKYHPLAKCTVSVVMGKEWKRIRSALSPSFKTSVMKEVFEAASRMSDGLISSLEIAARDNRTVNVEAPSSPIRKLTIEVLARFIFGAELLSGGEAFPDELNMLAASRNPQTVSLDLGKLSFLSLLFNEYPTLLAVLMKLRISLFGGRLHDYEQKINQFISLHSKETRKSALRIMLQDAAEKHPHIERSSQSGHEGSRMNEYEVLANCISLVVAGYDSTSNCLCFAMYLLAKHTDVQEKLRDEVLTALEKEGTLNYGNVSSLTYLNQVILENLRLFPPLVNFGTRNAEAECTHNGIIIPKGVSVVASNFHLHRDPKFWPDPESFLPERFSPQNKASINADAYQPFGLGPRKCIAEKLAMLYMKLVLSRVIAEFRISLDEERHKDGLTLETAVMILKTKEGIWLKFEKARKEVLA